MWECALDLCNDLKVQYEQYLYDYSPLSNLYRDMAVYYESILNERENPALIRNDPEYFRVGFFGLGYPRHLQNKVSQARS